MNQAFMSIYRLEYLQTNMKQNIIIAKDSSLSNTDVIKIEDGVCLKQFAPFREREEDNSKSLEDKLKERFESPEYQNRKVTFMKQGEKPKQTD